MPLQRGYFPLQVGRALPASLTLNSALFRLQPLLDAFPGCVGKALRGGRGQMIRMLLGGLPEKTNLRAVTAAPFAETKMNAQSDFLRRRKRAIQRR